VESKERDDEDADVVLLAFESELRVTADRLFLVFCVRSKKGSSKELFPELRLAFQVA
jgi:hypothetical protein